MVTKYDNLSGPAGKMRPWVRMEKGGEGRKGNNKKARMRGKREKGKGRGGGGEGKRREEKGNEGEG